MSTVSIDGINLKYENVNSLYTINIIPSSSTTMSYDLTLPVDDGISGQVLSTNGSGVLSWINTGTGDVTGPASATDNAIARFDTTTGKLLQNSVVIVDDIGIITGVVDLTYSGQITSTISTGTPPLVVSSTTQVANFTATNSVNVGITDDNTTNATMYPTWVTTTTGNLPEKVSSTKLTFNPSTGTLTTTTFSGAITLANDTTNQSDYLVFSNGATGSQALKTNTNIRVNPDTTAGGITISNTTSSTSNSTGAITTSGGIASSNTTDATSSTNGGTFTTAGGMAIAKKLYVGGITSVTDTTASTSSTTGALLLSGGIGVAKNTWIGSAFTAANTTTAGSVVNVPAFTYTTSTSNPTNINVVSIGPITLNGTGTATSAASLYLSEPILGGSSSIIDVSNPYTLQTTGGGNSYFDGSVTVNGYVTATLSQSSTGAQQGKSCAIYGTGDNATVLVGGNFADSNLGAVWVYIRTAGVWSMQQKLQQSSTGAQQGFSCAIYGTGDNATTLVGGLGADSNLGAVWVYTRSGSTWSLQQKLQESSATALQGRSCSIYGTGDNATILNGGPAADSGLGAVWVYTRSGSTWSLQQKLQQSSTGAQQGFSCAIYGTGDNATALVGGNLADSNLGAVWVYTRSGSTWSMQQKLQQSSTGAFQGSSCSIYGIGDNATALVGGIGADSNLGAVWVYTRSSSTWSLQQKLQQSSATGAFQGRSCSIYGTGDNATILVGGDGADTNVGAVWVYTRSGTTWSLQQRLQQSAVVAAQGTSCSIYNNLMLVGGPTYSSSIGATWVYTNSLVSRGKIVTNECVVSGAFTVGGAGSSTIFGSGANFLSIIGPNALGGGNANILTYNSETSTSSDSSPVISVYKGSATTSSSQRFIQFASSAGGQPMGGIVGNGATNVQFTSLSDQRLKKNITPISNSLGKILSLEPKTFEWIANSERCPAGFIAQDVQQVFPEFVFEDDDGLLNLVGLSPGINVHIVCAIKELSAKIDTIMNHLGI